MSFDALATCINIKDVKPISKLVLLILANYADEDWKSYPSKSKIAELCNCDEQTIKRAIDELLEKNILICQQRFANGKQLSNLYTIVSRGVKFRGAKIDKLGGSNLYPNTIKDTINIKNNYTEEFEKFWKLYPSNEKGKKIGKFESFNEFKKCKDKDILIMCLHNYIEYKKGKFIHNPDRWIKKKIYLDFKTKQNNVSYTSKNNLAG
jgi:hypothetical protein|tara:strand:- start:176 stop:796 length:621 start_codon:yes stop_codon:yes gene_type:complete